MRRRQKPTKSTRMCRKGAQRKESLELALRTVSGAFWAIFRGLGGGRSHLPPKSLRNACSVFLTFFFMSGCYAWEKTHPGVPKSKWRYVYAVNPGKICIKLGLPLDTIACAIWSDGYCTMYLPFNAPQWMVLHEEMHCQGYTH
jgi:hypothetical protein